MGNCGLRGSRPVRRIQLSLFALLLSHFERLYVGRVSAFAEEVG